MAETCLLGAAATVAFVHSVCFCTIHSMNSREPYDCGRGLCFAAVSLLFFVASPISVTAAADVEIRVDAGAPGKEIDLTRYALGQGGLSEKPMFDPHIETVAQLHPQTIRIFVQEFFDLYPRQHRYHWSTLNKVIETILATKAKPII